MSGFMGSEELRKRNREAVRRYRAAHLEKIREAGRRYRAANPEKKREYYTANSERCLLWSREWNAAHKPNVRAASNKWKRAHPEEMRAQSRKWRAVHLKQSRERVRREYALNADKRCAYARMWRIAHPDELRVQRTRRRCRATGNGGSHTAAEWIVLCWASGWRCYYCGAGPLTGKLAIQEHRVPLSRGGTNDIGNIALSCAPCNQRKWTFTDVEYAKRLRA